MDTLDFPVNRSDANQPEEINPWKEHVIENQPTHDSPRNIPSPGDVPPEHDEPSEEMIDRIGTAAEKTAEFKKTITPEMTGEMDTPKAVRLAGAED